MIEQITQTLRASFADADIQVQGEGGKFLLQVTDTGFDGLNAVKRQQKVYAGLGDLISSGAVHAVTIVAKTPAEVAAATGFNQV
ncbi:BolA/IbaG family iron-sulfur metabolism protein [Litorivicinus lipolyticus]|jgi:acid stress-induced BolA-like protein IbaG/YrbA|uniref:BolA/IbaG family iron-sulfur metabolism protein n=1 Tax=Litorivicinus lipolyticus TaxID=418701 RepID=A0A5Q2QCF0_9GAMM|nr:BolA/IbaG family iron-sulfur metabolism protein [Litorivicinus lipolyticus]QGG80973.1 BolA/IbaG family iron-sulfur metabolism protein [Litorivicinus lipolyticus]